MTLSGSKKKNKATKYRFGGCEEDEQSNNQTLIQDALIGYQTTGSNSIYPKDEGIVSDDEVYGEYEKDEGCLVIKLSQEEKIRLRRPWRQTLIVKVMGRTIGYNYLFRLNKALWKPKVPTSLVALENDYFIVRFSSIDDYDHAKFEGPWMIMDHYLLVVAKLRSDLG